MEKNFKGFHGVWLGLGYIGEYIVLLSLSRRIGLQDFYCVMIPQGMPAIGEGFGECLCCEKIETLVKDSSSIVR